VEPYSVFYTGDQAGQWLYSTTHALNLAIACPRTLKVRGSSPQLPVRMILNNTGVINLPAGCAGHSTNVTLYSANEKAEVMTSSEFTYIEEVIPTIKLDEGEPSEFAQKSKWVAGVAGLNTVLTSVTAYDELRDLCTRLANDVNRVNVISGDTTCYITYVFTAYATVVASCSNIYLIWGCWKSYRDQKSKPFALQEEEVPMQVMAAQECYQIN
jgi:hypothetical protein